MICPYIASLINKTSASFHGASTLQKKWVPYVHAEEYAAKLESRWLQEPTGSPVEAMGALLVEMVPGIGVVWCCLIGVVSIFVEHCFFQNLICLICLKIR